MLPVSEKRLQANRANAQRSTGPRTPEGKARSSRNALRHGLLARQLVIGDESPDNLRQFTESLIRRFQPADDFEFSLVADLAAATWRLRRAWSIETEMLTETMERYEGQPHHARLAAAFSSLADKSALPLLHRYETRLHTMRQRALQNLLLIRQFPPADPAPEPEAAPEPAPEPAPPEPTDPDLPNEPTTGPEINELSPSAPAQLPPPKPIRPVPLNGPAGTKPKLDPKRVS